MMATLSEQRAAAIKAAEDLINGAQKDDSGNPMLSKADQDAVDAKFAEVKSLDEQIESAKAGAATADQLKSLSAGQDNAPEEEKPAKSLGDHVVKSFGESGLQRLKNIGQTTVSTPEFKANTDAHTVGGEGGAFEGFVTDVDTSLVRGYRRQPVVADLLGTGSLSGTVLKYYVEGPFEGSFSTVAETGQKPQIHIGDPDPVTESTKKIAAWFDMSDEMIEDVAFYVSEVNNRAIYELAMLEENQLLNGDGTGQNLLGLLQRSGIQSVTSSGANDDPDALFRAITATQTGSGLSADAVVINPADYQRLRLSKDGNQQYYGGGFFAGQYGQGGVPVNPPLWGRNTVVTPAVAEGTAVVGALRQAATVYRKGGVRVESTNSDQGKFTSNVVTTRIEERLALAVRRPSAIVSVTLSSAPAEGGGE